MNKHVKRMQSAAICAALLWSAGAYPLAEGVKPLLTSITAYAQDGTLANGLHYRIIDGAAIINGYTGSEASIEIPSEIDGYPVTEIGWSAFSGCTSLTSVTIPEGVTSINHEAFRNCTNLETISFPSTLTSIGDEAFWGTSWNGNLTDEFIIIGNGVLYQYNGTSKHIIIPQTVKYLADGFCDNSWNSYRSYGVNEITFPDNLEQIYLGMFEQWGGITVNVGTNTKEIGLQCSVKLNGLAMIKAVNVSKDNPYLMSVDGVLFNKEQTEILYYPNEKKDLDQYTIPSTVTKIGRGCFFHTSLQSVWIPDQVTEIEECAFLSAESLKTVRLSENLTYIGTEVFNGAGLTSVEIPMNVTSIGYWAFFSCSALESITIPDSVTNIGEYAFEGTPWLSQKQKEDPLVIVNGILIDGTTCSGDVVIPEGVTSIGERAFFGCTSLTSITIPESATRIDGQAFCRCTSLTSVTIPDSVTSMGYGAFSDCTSLTSITIPEDVTSIGESAFESCTSLTSITIPDSVTRIGSYAFFGCTGLKLITILNPACEIYDDNTTLSDSAVIMGYQNSTAQKYAEKNNRAFEPMAQGNAVGDEAAGAQIWGCTMTLGEQLTLNYQVHLTAETASDANAYMLFILPDGSIQRVPVADAKINADDLYVFPCSFPARMMNQQIYARLVTSDANSDFHGYSGAKYLETVAADSSNEAAQELAQKTLDYGTYAEAYFDKNAATVPEDNEMRNTTISAKPVRIDGDLPEGIAYYGMSLLLRDQVAVRLYFDVDDSVHASAYGLTHKEGTYYYLDTPVSAENLLNEQTVNIGSASITFSSMSYASLACSSSSDEKLQATMKSLYLYAKAAQEYQEYLDPFPQGSAWRVKAGCSFVVELYPSSEGYMNATEGYVITILGTYNGSSCEVAVSERFGAAVKYGKIINLSVEDKEFLTRLEE